MMEKQGSYSENFPALDYNGLEADHNHHQPELMRPPQSSDHNHTNHIVDYMLNNPQAPPPLSSNFGGSNSFDKLSFADVMQFADFGPKLGLNHTKTTPDEEETSYFLKFPVLNDHKLQQDHHHHNHHHDLSLMASQALEQDNQEQDKGDHHHHHDDENTSVQMRFLGENLNKSPPQEGNKGKRKRPRSLKTSEEVESQRMTHIAVERNRRKQMNEHLRVLRSLMPTSYVQRGDQASIIGGAIEFVRELEQLLQCLESQKRRRLYGDGQRQTGDSSMAVPPPPQPQPPLPFPPPTVPIGNVVDYESGLQEETAESKSYLADVEVKVLGFDALIKILSRRRPGQLIQTIAALEDMQLNILHTNITTIEQTVLYSFNVKIGGEARLTAEDLANSVQQIFNFIHANTTI